MADQYVSVRYFLDEAGIYWVAVGRDLIPAPPFTPPPPVGSPFLLNDAASLLNGTKVLT